MICMHFALSVATTSWTASKSGMHGPVEQGLIILQLFRKHSNTTADDDRRILGFSLSLVPDPFNLYLNRPLAEFIYMYFLFNAKRR